MTIRLSEYDRLDRTHNSQDQNRRGGAFAVCSIARNVQTSRRETNARRHSRHRWFSAAKRSHKDASHHGLTILEAKQSGAPLPLFQEGQHHSAILIGPGPFAVSLGVAAPLTIEAGRASFTLPVPLASSAHLNLELPGNHADVHVEPGLVTTSHTANGNTLVEAALEPGKPARIWWTTREIAAPVAQREVRFLSDIKTVVSVGDSQLATDGSLRCDGDSG